MRWAGHVVCMGEMKKSYNICVGKPEGRDGLDDLDVDGNTI
jgi:hypothetical protein